MTLMTRSRSAVRAPAVLTASLAAVAVLAAGQSGAEAAVSAAPPVPPVTTTTVRAALAPLIAAGAPGAVALVDRDAVPVRAAAGVADTDPPQAAAPGMQTRVGSITKSFVATIALQLVGEGRLELDKPIGTLVPGVPSADKITLRMLMNHTSGLFNYTEDDAFVLTLLSSPSRLWKPAELLAVAAQHPLNFPPGTDWWYSNTNFVVVGMILEKVTGTPLQTLLKDRITGPLGLSNTYLATGSGFTNLHLHGIIPPGPLGPDPIDTTSWTPSWAWAAGAIVSTTADLQTFYRALLRGQLLHGRQLQAMTTLVPLGPDFGYGLGLYAADFGCGTTWGHDGGMPGYTTVAGLTRNGRRAAILLTNADASVTPDPAANVSLAYQRLSCLAIGATPPPLPTPSASGSSTSGSSQGERTASTTVRTDVPASVLARKAGIAARANLLPSPLAARG